jgi:hypothetical protein
MAGEFGRPQTILFALWVLVFVGIPVIVFQIPEAQLSDVATARGELRVYSNSEVYRELKDSATFGLQQLASVVNYLLLAAAGLLAFSSKTLTDLRSEEKVHVPPTRRQLLLLLHSGIACFFSLWMGGLGYLSLPDIAVTRELNVSGHLSRLVIGQIAGLLFGAALLLLAFAVTVKELLPNRREL